MILLILASKVLKETEACKAKIAASEDFALAETLFALAEGCTAPQIRSLTKFQPQFTHFRHRHPLIKWQKTKLFEGNPPDFTEKVVTLQRNFDNKRYA